MVSLQVPLLGIKSHGAWGLHAGEAEISSLGMGWGSRSGGESRAIGALGRDDTKGLSAGDLHRGVSVTLEAVLQTATSDIAAFEESVGDWGAWSIELLPDSLFKYSAPDSGRLAPELSIDHAPGRYARSPQPIPGSFS